jgi:hypothetical protein
MDLETKRSFMITNRNLNSMIKPNIVYGKYTVSSGMNTDAGIGLIDGKVNHHTSMILDVIYDHMYRMFNELGGMNYVVSSLTKLLASNDGKRHDYFTKLLTDKKIDFYNKILKLGQYFMHCKNNDLEFRSDSETRDLLLNGCPDIIENAFGPEFSIPYRSALEAGDSLEGPLQLLNDFNFERQFFTYILSNIFYGKYPQWNNFHLKIDLRSVFDNNERTIYVLKKWFEENNNLKLNMTYPVTCFADIRNGEKYLPKKLFLKSVMMPLVGVKPISSECDKSMTVDLSLANKFMVYFAHDAKMCVRTYVPSSLYTLNNNAYFIGKSILNNTYYSKRQKAYTTKLNYTLGDMFEYLNLPEKDINNGNNSHRRKAIFKALRQLDDLDIIKIDKMNSQRIVLKSVWNIKFNEIPDDTFNG